MNNRKRHIGRMIMKVTAVLAVLTLSTPVHAGGSIESEGIKRNQTGKITVKRAPDSKWPVSGTVFHLYKVADLEDDMTFTYTDEFKGKAGKDILPSASVTPDSRWESSTKALMKTIDQNDIQPVKTLSWDTRIADSVVFNKLSIGLYLLTTDPVTYNQIKYVSSGNLISVPFRSSNQESWQYDYSVQMKHTEETVPPTPVSPSPTPSSSTKVTPSPSEKTTGKKDNPSPKPSPSENADTGDHSHTGLYAGALIAMVIVIGIVLNIRKQDRKN